MSELTDQFLIKIIETGQSSQMLDIATQNTKFVALTTRPQLTQIKSVQTQRGFSFKSSVITRLVIFCALSVQLRGMFLQVAREQKQEPVKFADSQPPPESAAKPKPREEDRVAKPVTPTPHLTTKPPLSPPATQMSPRLQPKLLKLVSTLCIKLLFFVIFFCG